MCVAVKFRTIEEGAAALRFGEVESGGVCPRPVEQGIDVGGGVDLGATDTPDKAGKDSNGESATGVGVGDSAHEDGSLKGILLGEGKGDDADGSRAHQGAVGGEEVARIGPMG